MKILFSLLAIVALGCGYFYYNFSPAEGPAEVPVGELQEAAYTPASTISAPAQIAVFENREHALTFKYRIKPYGYSVFEYSPQQNSEIGSLFGVTFVRSNDYNEAVKSAAEGNGHDGPPSIFVYVYDGTGVTDLSAWLVKNVMITNCHEGQVLATTLAGKDASSCLWDGLYLGVTVALLNNNKIYVLSGTREGNETLDGYSYEKDFNEMVESFGVTN